MVIYKIIVFGADRKSNMAARAHNVFWLVEILTIFLLETTKQIELWLLQEWLLGGPVLNLWIVCQSEIQDGRQHFHLFFWNHKTYLKIFFSETSKPI